jgi:hypothetical protein
MTPLAKRPRLYYGWFVVAVTAVAQLVSAGVRSAPGVFLTPLQEEVQWSTGVISFAVSIGWSAPTSSRTRTTTASPRPLRPVTLLFFLQRYFIEGITLTGLKG